VDYISSILSALYNAKKDTEKLLALRDDLRDAQTTADLYKIYANKLEKSNAALHTIFTTLIRALPPNAAQNLAIWGILQAYGTGALKSSDGAKMVLQQRAQSGNLMRALTTRPREESK